MVYWDMRKYRTHLIGTRPTYWDSCLLIGTVPTMPKSKNV